MMEQQAAKYWMLMKTRKHILRTRIEASIMKSSYDSWEEQAFAEDSAGPLGGCIWPPRSYSCSFCRREFRSAQALGGHMNVHRRDRARLKQSLTLSPHDHHHHHHYNHDDHHDELTTNPYKSLVADQYPSPYSNPSSVPSDLFPPRVSLSASPYFCPPSYATKLEKNTKKEEITRMGKECFVDTDLYVGLNLVVHHNQPSGSDGNAVVISSKRHKGAVSPPSMFLFKPCTIQSEIDQYGLKPSSIEELDLELRLGVIHQK